jgi:uncharacterized membrane protein YeaQ/YmgE (transglycosylase-associated protein family)
MPVASVTLGTVLGVLFSAFVTGALARFAVPGPDPMPAWLTIAVGLAGSAIGGGIAYAAGSRSPYVITSAGFLAATALVVLYRRFVQKRPLWGPDAYRFPKRGVGVEAYRQRLTQAGIDPDRIGPHLARRGAQQTVPAPSATGPGSGAGDPTENPSHYLTQLAELHDSGVLTDEEYDAARTRLVERLRG